jgi:PKD repeat protein
MLTKRLVLISSCCAALVAACDGDDGTPVQPSKPTANFSASPTSGMAPLTVNFTDLSTSGPTSWSWTFGDGGNSAARNPSHIYAAAGTYDVSLTATNAYGNDAETKTGYITVSPLSQVTLVASKDNTLYEDAAGAWSNGAGNWFFAGMTAGVSDPPEIRRGVLAFNVAGGGVPPGSTIDSVFLVLSMDKTNAGGTTVALHRLTSDWGEGTSMGLGNEGGGDASDTGDATWIHTFYNTSFWTNPGGDFAGIAGSIVVAGNGTYTWGSTPEMVADVQGWLDTPATNYGWVLIGDEVITETAKRFASRTHPTTASRPRLVVHFTAP